MIVHLLTEVVRGTLGKSKRVFEVMVDMVETSEIYPLVGKAFEWEDAHKAFEL